MTDPIVVVSVARTPIGSFRGALAPLTSTRLGAIAAAEAVARAGIAPGAIDQALIGCVLPAGLGQAPARQVALGAGLPESVRATTVNKMCGSGMQAAILAHDALAAGSAEVVLVGGIESMSNAPYLLPKHRVGPRMGHDVVKDSMWLDGLEDAYEPGRLMGVFAEQVAQAEGFTREDQDAFALRSLERANAAIRDGRFAGEIVPVRIPGRDGEVVVEHDEPPGRGRPEKIPLLKPAFSREGTVTAANSSSISDGAAALVLTRASVAQRLGLAPVARIVAHAGHAHAPALFATAPVPAIRQVLKRARWQVTDVDLFEVNEAFAVVALYAARELGIAPEILNVHGGACALGHPIGASGARVLVTLVAALRLHGLKRGVAGICIGGGEATAVALELL
jgi:acetyl-CoA C-acetyltransferase